MKSGLNDKVYFAVTAIILAVTLPSLAHGPNCRHNYPKIDDIPHHVHLRGQEGSHRISKRSLEQDLRIKVFYHDSIRNLDNEKKTIVTDIVVPNGVGFWGSVLKVRRNEATIRLNRRCDKNQYFLFDNQDGSPNNTQFCKNRCVETKCGEFVVPDAHLEACHTCNNDGYDCQQRNTEGAGIDRHDFILYVTSVDTKQCGSDIGFGGQASTVAYAAHCQQEVEFDRPIAGHMNICPKSIVNGTKEIEGLTSTVKHELLHALGFSMSLFAFFRDDQGRPLTKRGPDGKPPINRRLQVRQWGSNIIQKYERDWKVRSGRISRTVHMIVTPRVREEVRRHFNCPSLEGAELEDQGGDGTELTHWEKRIFQNEAMTGTVHTNDPIYSKLTFALMEDTGWYLPDYSKADEISWGKNAGCDFVKKSCMELMELEGNRHFCTTLMSGTTRIFCNHDRTSVGSCNMVKYQGELPSIYQNFQQIDGVRDRETGEYGGSVALADYCPYVQEFSWKSTDNSLTRGTRCTDPANQPAAKGRGANENYALETYSPKSKCFEQGGSWSQRSCTMMKEWRRFGAGCYDYECKDGMLNIMVNINGRTESIECDKPGQNISIAVGDNGYIHQGSIQCPDCNEVCSSCLAPNEVVQRTAKILEDQKVGINDSLVCGFGGLFDILRGSRRISATVVNVNLPDDESTSTTTATTSTSSSSRGTIQQVSQPQSSQVSTTTNNPTAATSVPSSTKATSSSNDTNDDLNENNDDSDVTTEEEDRTGKSETIMGSLLRSFFKSFGIALK